MKPLFASAGGAVVVELSSTNVTEEVEVVTVGGDSMAAALEGLAEVSTVVVAALEGHGLDTDLMTVSTVEVKT